MPSPFLCSPVIRECSWKKTQIEKKTINTVLNGTELTENKFVDSFQSLKNDKRSGHGMLNTRGQFLENFVLRIYEFLFNSGGKISKEKRVMKVLRIKD